MKTAYDFIKGGESEFFSLDEWAYPEELKLVDERVVRAYHQLRVLYGQPIYPGRAQGAWARTTGSKTSQHYAEGRLSTAGDAFPSGDVLDCWLLAQQIPEFGGFGLYLDTTKLPKQPGAMLHLDIRKGPRVYWVRNEVGKYLVKGKSNVFWDAVSRVRFK